MADSRSVSVLSFDNKPILVENELLAYLSKCLVNYIKRALFLFYLLIEISSVKSVLW